MILPIAFICPGPTPQQPLIISAPKSIHSFTITSQAADSVRPDHVLVPAWYTAPELGYTIIFLSPDLVLMRCISSEMCSGAVQLTPMANTTG
jgi:hypothetical protein